MEDLMSEIQSQECARCGASATCATDAEGARICADCGAAGQAGGEQFISWDGNAPQSAQLTPAEARARCTYCGAEGPAGLFEPFNKAGNLACKAGPACQLRQAGERPAYVLAALLRAVRPELGTLTTAELAALAVDLDEYATDVHIYLSGHGDSAAALEAERADRARRARSRAALKGHATRKAATS